MVELYKRQGKTLSAPMVEPAKGGYALQSLSSGALQFSEKYAKQAQQNFALGSAYTINASLEEAYQANKTNAQGFVKTLGDVVNNATKNLSKGDRDVIRAAVDKRIKPYLSLIGDNKLKEADEQTRRYGYGLLGQYELEDNLNRDELYNAIATGQQDIIKQQRQVLDEAQQKKIKLLNERRLSDGSMIITDKQYATILSGQEGHLDSFKKISDGMSYDAYENFYKEKFSNREQFMAQSGMDRETYEKAHAWAQHKLTQNKRDKEADVRNVASHAAIDAMNSSDPEIVKQVMEGDTPDNIKKAYKMIQDIKPDTIRSTSAAREFGEMRNAFLLAAKAVTEGKNAEFHGDNTKMEAAIVAYAKELHDFAGSQGLSDEEKSKFIDVFQRAMFDERFGDYVENATQLIEDYGLKDGQELLFGKPKYDDKQLENMYTARVGGAGATQRMKQRDQANELAFNYAKKALSTEAELAYNGHIDEAMELRKQTMKQVANIQASWMIAPNVLEDLDNKLTRGEHPIYSYNNVSYEYAGRNQKYQPLFKRIK